MAQRVIVILGMHRSGTSALAGSLEQAGVALGHVVRASDDNPKGWCESPVVFTLHEQMFRLAGGNWAAPPKLIRWHPAHVLIRNTFIDAFRHHDVWGFKDPRTVFTLEGWLDVLPNAELVGIVRHPLLVAQSLIRRNMLMLQDGLHVWTRYNTQLLHWYKQRGFPLLSFDDLEYSFPEQLQALTEMMELPRTEAGPKSFFETQHRHAIIDNSVELPRDVCALYEELKDAHISSIAKRCGSIASR